MKKRLLSKSKYMSGLQCRKYLWFIFNDPTKVAEPDAGTQYSFDQGHQLGELAKKLFPNGIDIPTEDFLGNLNQTKKLLMENRPLFEPAFYVDNVYSRLDILNPVGDGYVGISMRSRVQRQLKMKIFTMYLFSDIALRKQE